MATLVGAKPMPILSSRGALLWKGDVAISAEAKVYCLNNRLLISVRITGNILQSAFMQHPRHVYHANAAAYKAQTPYVANASVTTLLTWTRLF